MASELLQWKEEFSVEVEEIDIQHKNIVKILNDLNSAFMEKKQEQVIEKIVAELSDYTVYHFDTEERYFLQFDFEHSQEHIREHNDFKEKVLQFEEKLKTNKTFLTYEVISFLKDWLVKHIAGSDKLYIKCFKDNGLKQIFEQTR